MSYFLQIFRIPHIIRKCRCQHLSHTGNGTQCFFVRCLHSFQIVIKITAQHLGIGHADSGDPQSIDQPGQRGMSCSLDTVHHILIGFFSESFHSGNDLLVTVQPEQIRIFMDKALIDQLLQCCLGESVNIQRISADEQSVGFDLLGRAFLIGAVQRLYLIHLSDLRGLSAHRTHLWNLHIITACQILSDLGNDHVGLIDRDMVSDSQSEGSHDTDIMHGSAAHRCAFQFHRLKNSYRIDQTGTAGAPLDLF